MSMVSKYLKIGRATCALQVSEQLAMQESDL